MKRVCSLLLLFSLPLFSIGCEKAETFRDDLSCEALVALSLSSIFEGDFLVFGEDHIRYSFENTNRFADCRLVYSARAENIDELGIFLAATDADVDELRRLCEQYVRTLRDEQRAFVASYAPREASKLDAATVRTFGRYVVYTVLSEAECEQVLQALSEALKK